MSTTRHRRYQEGSIAKVKRGRGRPAAWVFRWREELPDGTRVQRKKTIGTTEQFKDKAAVQAAVANLRAEVNAQNANIGRYTIEDLWGHFVKEELRSTTADRSLTTIDCYLDNFRLHILPKWGRTFIEDLKAPAVEKWLGCLDLAPATKSKLRNQLSALYSHAIRHELYDKLNPISSVRQSAKRQRVPDTLTLPEMQAILANLPNPMHRLAVLIAAVTALRRSEVRGLRWSDVQLNKLWLNLRTGVVRNHHTKLKTEASAKGVPIPAELGELFVEWRNQCFYPDEDAWVFASPFTDGKKPFWLETMLPDHIQPAAKSAGISKTVGWHTFRHSLATLLGDKGEKLKVVQELLRHSSPTITALLYQQAEVEAKRTAQGHVHDLFLVDKAA